MLTPATVCHDHSNRPAVAKVTHDGATRHYCAWCTPTFDDCQTFAVEYFPDVAWEWTSTALVGAGDEVFIPALAGPIHQHRPRRVHGVTRFQSRRGRGLVAVLRWHEPGLRGGHYVAWAVIRDGVSIRRAVR